MATKDEEKPAATKEAETPEAEEDEEEAKPGEPTARTQKRRDRYNEMRAQAEAAEARAREADERARKIEADLAEVRGRISQREEDEKRRAQAGAVTDYEARIEKFEDDIFNAYKNNDYKTGKRLEREQREYERQQANKQLLEEWEKKIPKVDPMEQQRAIQAQMLNHEFPTLATNQKLQRAADGYINVLAAQGHNPDSLETWRQAVRRAATDMGVDIGGQAPRSNATQQRLYGAVAGNSTTQQGSSPEELTTADEKVIRLMENNHKNLGPDFRKRFIENRKKKAAG